MRWVQAERAELSKASVLADLARRAAIKNPDSPWSKLASADSAFELRDFARAALLYDAASKAGIDPQIPWHRVVRCHLEMGQNDAALAASRRGFEVADEPGYHLRIQTGLAYSKVGDTEQAHEQFLAAAAVGSHHEACWFILHDYARSGDARGILAQCDEMEAAFGQSATFRANRAIAYSLLGDASMAKRLVDLDAHVQTGSIAEFFEGDIAQFHEALAAEALDIAADSGTYDKSIVTTPDLSNSPTIQTLQEIVRTAITAYLAEADARGLDDCLPLPIEQASLSTGVTLLRRDGRNGQHIHMSSVISAVYHVGNPADADDHDSGALQIGPVSQYAGGHVPIWGERRILPQPGQLTIFPAHFFHDVIPTRSDTLRLSFPSDVHLIG